VHHGLLRRVTATSIAACASVLLLACGGRQDDSTFHGGAADGGDGSSGDGAPACVTPPQHRPSAAACPVHGDGGAPCSGASSCIPDGGAATPYSPSYCIDGRCGFDQCLTDADCQGNEVCACAGSLSGTTPSVGANHCVPANCHVDSDCGPCGFCSPTAPYGCGPGWGTSQYACHRPGDSCYRDTDCGMSTGNPNTIPYCAWNPTSGGWSCATGICSG
jgi:hypothetical protein